MGRPNFADPIPCYETQRGGSYALLLIIFRLFNRGITERGVFAFAFQCIVSPRGQTGNCTVTQVRHPLLVEG